MLMRIGWRRTIRATSTTRVTGKAVEVMSITTMLGIEPGSETSAGATVKNVHEARAASTRGAVNAAPDQMRPEDR